MWRRASLRNTLFGSFRPGWHARHESRRARTTSDAKARDAAQTQNGVLQSKLRFIEQSSFRRSSGGFEAMNTTLTFVCNETGIKSMMRTGFIHQSEWEP